MKRSLAGNAVYNMAYNLMNVVFPLISAGYVARILSADGVGKVAYAQNILSYFLMFAALAIPSYGTREIARLRDMPSETDRVFSELFLLNAIGTLICLLGYYTLVGAAFHRDALLYLIVGLELVFNFLSIDWLYQGKEIYGYITARSFLVKVISLAALFLFVKDKQDYPIYAMIHCVGVGCNHCFNVFYSRKIVRFTIRGLNLKRHFAPVMWLMLSMAAASLYNKVDVTMLGAMSTVESVAYYTNAHKIISIVLALVTAVSGVFLPRLSFVYANDRARFSEYLNIGLKVVVCLALPACIGIILVSKDLIVAVFGNAFVPGVDVLQILSVFTIVKSVGDLLCYQAIISSGKERMLIFSRLAGGLTNIVLNAMLIPRYGHNGAAIASVISEVVVNGVLLPHALCIAPIRLPSAFVVSVTIGTVAMGAAVMFAQKLIDAGVVRLCVTVALGAAIYTVMMFLTRNELIGWMIRKIRMRIAGQESLF